MSQSTLNMIKRWEAAHANAVENYPLFVAGMLLALHAKLPVGTLDGLWGRIRLPGRRIGLRM
jgi:uncharacterized MAPEG superfamily protein